LPGGKKGGVSLQKRTLKKTLGSGIGNEGGIGGTQREKGSRKLQRTETKGHEKAKKKS